MAKAVFQKGQRVWVECVGSWAVVERVVPVWAKGFDEPVRIGYDVGLGREFQAGELTEEREGEAAASPQAGRWRLLRAKNKWQTPAECATHPQPGTYPVVVTDPNDWGGWRVPGAEYDRDPEKIEFQARLIAAAPQLMRLAQELVDSAGQEPEETPLEILRLARIAGQILDEVEDRRSEPRLDPRLAQEYAA